MKVIIPVAGIGSRLRPHTHTIPKVLLNVGGKPILGHIVSQLIDVGVKKAVIVVGYLGDMVREYLTSTFSIEFEFVEQEEALGLGHAVWLAQKFFTTEEKAFIVLGDTIFNADVHSVLQSQSSSLGVKVVDDPHRFGVVYLKDNKVIKLVEKPERSESNLALVGLYYIKNTKLLFQCLNELIEQGIKTKSEFQLTDALQMMITKGEEFSVFSVNQWYDCGRSETIITTNRKLLTHNNPRNKKLEGVIINDPVYIDDDATVTNSIIGPFVTIAKGATVKNVFIKDSIISENASVESIMLLNSIIGKNAKIIGNARKVNLGDSSEIDLR